MQKKNRKWRKEALLTTNKKREELEEENRALREENTKLQRQLEDLELLLNVYKAELASGVDERKLLLARLLDLAEDLADSIMRDEEEEESKPN